MTSANFNHVLYLLFTKKKIELGLAQGVGLRTENFFARCPICSQIKMFGFGGYTLLLGQKNLWLLHGSFRQDSWFQGPIQIGNTYKVTKYALPRKRSPHNLSPQANLRRRRLIAKYPKHCLSSKRMGNGTNATETRAAPSFGSLCNCLKINKKLSEWF